MNELTISGGSTRTPHTKEGKISVNTSERENKLAISLDYGRLERRCLASIEDYAGEGELTETAGGMYIYKDNGSPVLAVAHLDTVQDWRHFDRVTIAGSQFVFNAQLDDRLGAYIILDLLPQLGVKCDVLLTEGEERGMSTAEWFAPDKPYNWMFSFDRTGEDVVLYQYDDKSTRGLLKGHKFMPAQGLWSDIAVLEHLGCKGFNIGCGYYNYHDKFAYMLPAVTKRQVKRFVNFYGEYKDTFIEYVPPKPKKSVVTSLHKDDGWTTVRGYSSRGYDDKLYCCDACGREVAPGSINEDCVYENGLCTECYKRIQGSDYYAF